MPSNPCDIRPERAEDRAAVAALVARASGPGRFARTAYRVREGAACVADLALTAWLGEELVGTVNFTAVSIGGTPGAVLLGPLAVSPDHMRRGYGRALIAAGLAKARDLGFGLVVLVGDLDYYGPVGFRAVPRGQIRLPGPVDPARLLAAELDAGALAGFQGLVAAA